MNDSRNGIGGGFGLGDFGDGEPGQPEPICSRSAPPPSTLVEAGSSAVPLRSGRFDFGSAALMILSSLRIRESDRELLRRGVESDSRLERSLSSRAPSPAAILRKAAKHRVRPKR